MEESTSCCAVYPRDVEKYYVGNWLLEPLDSRSFRDQRVEQHYPQDSRKATSCLLLKKQLVDKLVTEAMIDGKQNLQAEFRAKIMDLAVSKQLLDFPNDGEIVVRL